MDLTLRMIAAHPQGGKAGSGNGVEYALSTRRPALVLANGAHLVEQSTSTLGIRGSIRAPSHVEKLVYCGGAAAYVAFLEDRTVALFAELATGGIVQKSVQALPGDERSVALAAGSQSGSFVVLSKASSPSVYCVYLKGGVGSPVIGEVQKLRADIRGAQEKATAIDQNVAKLRGKVSAKVTSKESFVVALAAHPKRNLAVAAFNTGTVCVWEVMKKQIHSHYDAQLLLRERIVDIAFHPTRDLVVLCTNQGRIIAFRLKALGYEKGQAPQLAYCKRRDKSRRYVALCITPGPPTYLLVLTSARRVIARQFGSDDAINPSQRFPGASRPLPTVLHGAGVSFRRGAQLSEDHPVSLMCEPRFGLIAASLDLSGNVLVYHRNIDKTAGRRHAVVGAAIGTGFSDMPRKAMTGPVEVKSEGLFSHNGGVYSFSSRSSELIQLCRLPPNSEVRRIEVARDQFDSLLAALVFLHVEADEDPSSAYEVATSSLQFVIATRRGDGEAWNVSEPNEGASGCFLNASGRHDKYLTLSLDGKTVSVRSFVGKRQGKADQRSASAQPTMRGVQRFRTSDIGVTQVFRSPFSAWNAVVYEDQANSELRVSTNAYRRPPGGDSFDMAEDSFEVDAESSLQLQGGEHVLDLQWQRVPMSGSQREQFLGAIMTSQRLYVVSDVFTPVARYEFERVARFVEPFVSPTMCWMGPAVLITFGQFVYAVTVDSKADMIAGLSQGENACALVAALPDRVTYVRPGDLEHGGVAVVTRPVGMVSVLVRGLLALPVMQSRRGSDTTSDLLRDILLSHDASQGSEALLVALVRSDHAPIAYLLACSEHGKFSLAPLKRAAFLVRIGDLRGSLAVAEAEYARLPGADAFHEGTELYRVLQRILNVALASGDFAVGRRCSELLGRRGTFSAFVDIEGGHLALTALIQYAHDSGNSAIGDALKPLMEKSAKSCIATDSSKMPTRQQAQQAQAGIAALQQSAIALGTSDRVEATIVVPPEENDKGELGVPSREALGALELSRFADRLEMYVSSEVVQLRGQMEEDLSSDPVLSINDSVQIGVPSEVNLDAPLAVVGRPPGNPGAYPPVLAPPTQAEGGAMLEVPANWVAGIPNVGEGDLADRAAFESHRMGITAAEGSARAQGLTDDARALFAGPHSGAAHTNMHLNRLHEEERAITETAFGVRPDQIAQSRFESAMLKMDQGRYASALRELKSAIKVLSNARRDKNFQPLPDQVAQMVLYIVALELLAGMETLLLSPDVQTAPGKITLVQLALSLSALPLRPLHRVTAILLAVNASLEIGNFGTAKRLMEIAKEIGVPPARVPELRDKYNLCTQQQFVNSVPVPSTRLCNYTLSPIQPGTRELKCNFCPAFFSFNALVAQGVASDGVCPLCEIGKLR